MLPAGIHAETQAWKTATSTGGTAALGGMGDVEDCTRATDLAPLL